MKKEINKKTLSNYIFRTAICIAGIFILYYLDCGKESILISPLLAFNTYRLYNIVFESEKRDSKYILSNVDKISLLSASCNTVTLFLLCVESFSDLTILHYVIVTACFIAAIFSWLVIFKRKQSDIQN